MNPIEPLRPDFATVYAEHARVIHRYLARRAGAQSADELTSDTFVAAWRQWADYDADRGSMSAWLFGIATNLLRRRRRREDAELRALARAGAEPGTVHDRAGQAQDRLRLARVAEAIGRLRHDDRDVVLLIAWADLSYEEVATALDIPIGTVRSRLHRARHQLRLSELSPLGASE